MGRSPLFDYALKVEEVTTRKRSNLILNVDGAIAVAFVDLLRESGQFTREEADKYVKWEYSMAYLFLAVQLDSLDIISINCDLTRDCIVIHGMILAILCLALVDK